MKKKIFMGAAVLFSSFTHAQSSVTNQADSIAKNLDEVVVTANKFPAKSSSTGKVITVITRNDLEKSGSKDLAQLLSEQPGVYVSGANSNPGKDKSLYLLGASADHTLIAIDGVPVYDPSGIGSNFDIRLIPLESIERIEILKGSQGTLYGSDAIAGVINIITRIAEAKPLNLSGTLGIGSFGTWDAGASLGGTLGKTTYRADYTLHRTNGINEATDTVTRPHVTDLDGYRQQSLNAELGLYPFAGFSCTPYFRYTRIQGAIDQGAFTDELDYTTLSENVQAGVKNEWSLGKGVLHADCNFNQTMRTYVDDSTKSRNGFAIYSRAHYLGGEHYADVYLACPVTTVLRFLTGLDYRNSSSSQDYFSVSAYGPYKTALGKDSMRQNQLGLYGTVVMNAKNGFSVELGGRLNHHSAYGNNFVYNFNPSFLLYRQWKIFLNVSSGFRAPSLYQLFSEYGNRELDPEKAETYEGGLQYYAKGGRSNIRLLCFDRELRDAIVFFTDPVSYRSYYINQDKQSDQGLELESVLRLNKFATLKISYTYLTGSVTTAKGNTDTSFFNLYRRPKSCFDLYLGISASPRFYFSAGLQAVGKRTDIGYDAQYNPVQVTLKGYGLVNFYAEYRVNGERLKCFADLHNITGSKFTEVYGFNTVGFNGAAGIRFGLSKTKH